MKRFLILLLFTACFPEMGPVVAPEHSLSYSVSECYNPRPIADPLEYENALVDVTVFSTNETVAVKQRLQYNCCATLVVDYTVDGKKLHLYDKNEGTLCNCSCTYDLYADVSAQNISLFSLYGVGYSESKGRLLHREEVVD